MKFDDMLHSHIGDAQFEGPFQGKTITSGLSVSIFPPYHIYLFGYLYGGPPDNHESICLHVSQSDDMISLLEKAVSALARSGTEKTSIEGFVNVDSDFGWTKFSHIAEVFTVAPDGIGFVFDYRGTHKEPVPQCGGRLPAVYPVEQCKKLIELLKEAAYQLRSSMDAGLPQELIPLTKMKRTLLSDLACDDKFRKKWRTPHIKIYELEPFGIHLDASAGGGVLGVVLPKDKCTELIRMLKTAVSHVREQDHTD